MNKSRGRAQFRLDVDAPFCVVPPYIWSERDKLRAGSKTVCNEELALTAAFFLVSFSAALAEKVHIKGLLFT